MIADGVQRGYAEVRVAMSGRRGAHLPERPWRRKASTRRIAADATDRPTTPNDWAGRLRELAGAPAMATADAQPSPVVQRSAEAFRAMIAEERQREVEYSRHRRAKEGQA